MVSGVNSISAPGSLVTLTSLGRDQVLRFKAGDWVEILDDRTEFSEGDFDGTNFIGKPGFLTQIGPPPDEANRTISVTPAIPAGSFDPTDPTRHTRVRRWDQRFTGAGSDVDQATGLITVTAGPLDIEDGIQVSFSDDPAEGQLHVGDYWLFAARTADGSVESLQKAPPRGILHHYARLGFMTWAAGGTGTFADCRQFWPPPQGDCTGCCTVTVGDGINSQGEFINDIQGAINSLGIAGGEVCLGRGVFIVTKSILIDASKKNVTVRGMGWATKLIFTPDPQSGFRVLFDIQNTSHVNLESIFAVARSAESIVRITGSRFCAVRDTALINLNISPASGNAFLGSNASADVALSGRAIELLETCFDIQIERNTLIAAKGIVSGVSAAAAVGGITGTVSIAFDKTPTPLAGAIVTLTDPSGTTQRAITDKLGQFAFPSLPVGDYSLSASGQGLQTVTQSATVAANATTTVTFVIRPGAAPAASTATMSSAAIEQSDLNQTRIRENRILALLSSIFLVKTEDCDIIGNQLLGLNAETIKALQGRELTRDNIDNFQQTVLTVLTLASSSLAFQGAAIILLFGTRVTIAENQITGLVGVMAVFLSETRVRDNQILALLALLVLDGLLIRITGNFIAGLLAGWIQAGLLIDFACDSNLWLGLLGLVFMPLPLFQKQYGALFVTALESAGFASSGTNVTENVLKSITEAGANLGGIGVVALVKIHHEVFFTFLAGIVSESGVFSGDVAISDNSFEVCAQAGISWTAFPLRAFAKLLQPIHVVERNTMNVGGVGVICRCEDGVFRSNTIRCQQVGFDLTCLSGRVQDNSVEGTAAESNDTGLITLSPLSEGDQESSFRVTGNRLQNGPSHGILVTGSVDHLVVEDNFISHMAQNGVTTATGGVVLKTARICGNEIVRCLGADRKAPWPGTIILPQVDTDLLVHGNQLLGNGGIGMFLNVFAQDGSALRLRIQDNSLDGDGNSQMVNAVGNLIQFTGNQCTEPATQQTAVTLTGHLVVANGNTIYSTQVATFAPNSLQLLNVGSAPPTASAIVTSNILNGDPDASSFGSVGPNLVIANNIAL